MKLTVSKKLIMSVVSSIIFFGAIATGFVYFLTQKSLLENKRIDLVSNTVSQSNELKQIFINSENLVTTIAKQPKIIDYFSNKQDILELLRQYNINNQYSAIYLLNYKGIAEVSTDQSFVGNDYSFRDYYKVSIRGKNYTDVSIGATSGLLGYYFSSPVKSLEGNTLGVVVVKLAPEVVSEVISKYSESYKSLMLTDNYGVIVYSTDPSRIYKSLGQLQINVSNEILNKKRYSDKKIVALGYQVIQDQLNPNSQSKSFDVLDKEDGDETELVTFSAIDKYPFFLIGENLTDDIVDQSTRTSLTLAGLVMLAAIFAALIIALLVKKFIKPIDILKKASEDIKNGNLNQDIEIDTNDEFKDLANSLNEMMHKVKSSNLELEEKINERTENLKKINKLMVGREIKMMELKNEINNLKNK